MDVKKIVKEKYGDAALKVISGEGSASLLQHLFLLFVGRSNHGGSL